MSQAVESRTLKAKLFKLIGWIISALSIWYIYRVFQTMEHKINFGNDLTLFIKFSLFWCFMYALGFLGLGYVYRVILFYTSRNQVAIPLSPLLDIYTKANLSKYVPGNVLEFALRNFMGQSLGLNHKQIAMGSFFEMALSGLTGLLFSLLFCYDQFSSLISQRFLDISITAIALASFLGLALTLFFVIYILKNLKDYLSFSLVKMIFKTQFLYSFIYLNLGLILVFTFSTIFGQDMGFKQAALVVSALNLAWVAGFVVPGAPGGLGVKEAVLVMILSPTFGAELTVSAAIIHRLISVVGDLLTYLLGRPSVTQFYVTAPSERAS